MLGTVPLERPLQGDPRYASDAAQIHGATLELVAQPTQPIEGIVVSADTGEPLPDVEIASWQFAGSRWAAEEFLRTTTDEAGRFRLVGMPKGKGNVLYVRPNDEQPYFQQEFAVPVRPGLETKEFEIELDRGIWITGRVTEANGGKPGTGHVHWLPFFSNTNVQKLPRLSPGGMSIQGDQQRYVVQADGTFRLVGLPGPALIGVTSVGAYRQGTGYESIAGEKAGPYGLTYSNPVWVSAKWPTSMARIDPPADATSATCDLVLDPGETIRVRCVDEHSQPIDGVEIYGTEPMSSWEPLSGSSFEVKHLGPDEQRTVSARHLGRKIGRVTRLSILGGAEQSITLSPCVTVAGRVLDESGDPIARATITAWRVPSGDFDAFSFQLRANDAGEFRFDELLCGSDFELFAHDPEGVFIPLAKLPDPKPGQVIELGDVRRTRDQ
jgi:hypothetical protein